MSIVYKAFDELAHKNVLLIYLLSGYQFLQLSELPQRSEKHSHGIEYVLRNSIKWRMGWDSNPRRSCPLAGFQDRCLQPLGHPSSQFSYHVQKPSKQQENFVRYQVLLLSRSRKNSL